MTSIRHHLAELLESDRCISISSHEVSKIRNGTMSQNKLKTIIDSMKAEGCGLAHTSSIDPAKSSRLHTLSNKKYSVFKVDTTHDNVFHAFLHGMSFIVNHRPATTTILKRSTKPLRLAVVESVLKNGSLQNAMSRNTSRSYQLQFEVRHGHQGKRAYSEYSRKMQSNAFASYTEIAALSIYSGVEIHIYDSTSNGYVFVARYTPSKTTQKKRYVVRFVRGPRSTFDVLIPTAYHTHHGFWDRVNKNVLGRLGGNALNSPEKALETLRRSKNNVKNTRNSLPNENKPKTTTSFSWNASPKLTAA
jgi:hypothetical protein